MLVLYFKRFTVHPLLYCCYTVTYAVTHSYQQFHALVATRNQVIIVRFLQRIEHTPLPLGGVMLASASIGNLLAAQAPFAQGIFLVLALLMLACILAKFIAFPKVAFLGLNDRTTIATFGAFFMGVMVLSTYARSLSVQFGFVVWAIGIIGHGCLIVWFIIRALRTQGLLDIHPGHFVLLIGPIIACMTGTTYPVHAFLNVLLWVIIGITPLLLIAVGVRSVCNPIKNEAMFPLYCIYTAPPSICLNSYMVFEAHPNELFVTCVYGIACVLYIFACGNAIRCLKLRFYPSYAAMTFPFVISATASTTASFLLPNYSVIGTIASVQTVIALIMVVYVSIRYAQFIVTGYTGETRS